MVDTSNWELLRAFYDQMGLCGIEGESDGRFEYHMQNGREPDYVISVKHKHGEDVCVQVILEGKKEVLEYIIGLVKKKIR